MSNYTRTEEGFSRAMNDIRGFIKMHPYKVLWLYLDRASDTYVTSVITPSVSTLAEYSGATAFCGIHEDHTPSKEKVTDTMLKNMAASLKTAASS